LSHHQLEKDLKHLERVIPHLVVTGPFELAYWRRRITALKSTQELLPEGTKRVTRLLSMLDKMATAGPVTLKPARR
jgi:hypothetical protein